MNREIRPVYSFIANGSGAERCFHDLIRFALGYKYPPPLVVPLNDQMLTEVLFGFSVTDRIPIWDGEIISGQDFEELFISSIFLNVVEKKKLGKDIWLALPLKGKQESYDTVIVACDSKEIKIIDKKPRLPNSKSVFTLYIQVKRDYKYIANLEQTVVLRELDLSRPHEWSKKYSEFVLIFMQTPGYFNSDVAEKILKDRKAALIQVFNEDVVLIDPKTDKPNGNVIRPKSNSFNFLVNMGDDIHHVFFGFPPFLHRDILSLISRK